MTSIAPGQAHQGSRHGAGLANDQSGAQALRSERAPAACCATHVASVYVSAIEKACWLLERSTLTSPAATGGSRASPRGSYACRSNSVINASISVPFFKPRNTVSCCTTKPALRNRSW